MMRRYCSGFPIRVPALAAHCLLLTVLLAAALLAASCGGDTKKAADEATNGGEECDDCHLVSQTMKGTITVVGPDPFGKEVTETIVLDPNRQSSGGICGLRRSEASYSITTGIDAPLAAGLRTDLGSYKGPGTYHATDGFYGLDCALTVNDGELSGSFTCWCPSQDAEDCYRVRTMTGQFECLDPFERE